MDTPARTGSRCGEQVQRARVRAGLLWIGGFVYGWVSPKVFMPKARAAAPRAIALNEDLAEAHTLAAIAQNYDRDWPTAEKEYRRAVELNPNYATAHHWYAACLALQGRFNEVWGEIAMARELDPLSLIIAVDYGAFLYFARRYGPAIRQFQTVLEMDRWILTSRALK